MFRFTCTEPDSDVPQNVLFSMTKSYNTKRNLAKIQILNLDHIYQIYNCIVNVLLSATTATPLEHLGNTITSDYDGTPPLYITKTRKDNRDYIYVNNAEILRSRSNVQTVNDAGKKQVRTIFSLMHYYTCILFLLFCCIDIELLVNWIEMYICYNIGYEYYLRILKGSKAFQGLCWTNIG